MEITLINTSSENNRITKSMYNLLTIVGSCRDASEIESPSIMFESNNMLNYNYAWIPDFGRYYFVSNWRVVRNNIITADFSVDVLMSFKDSILKLNGILSQSENMGSMYLSSPVFNSLVKDSTDVLNFQNGLLENGEFILITAGG